MDRLRVSECGAERAQERRWPQKDDPRNAVSFHPLVPMNADTSTTTANGSICVHLDEGMKSWTFMDDSPSAAICVPPFVVGRLDNSE
jgi:hypothetical protein